MLMLIAFVTCLAGFAALALSLPKHARDLLGPAGTPTGRRACRLAGWTLLALSVALCLAAQGAANGCIVWFGLASSATLLVTLALTSASDPVFFFGKSGLMCKKNRQSEESRLRKDA